VPERFVGQPVTIYLYPSELQIHCRGALIAMHAWSAGTMLDRACLSIIQPHARVNDSAALKSSGCVHSIPRSIVTSRL
jgi:hypothetical protein